MNAAKKYRCIVIILQAKNNSERQCETIPLFVLSSKVQSLQVRSQEGLMFDIDLFLRSTRLDGADRNETLCFPYTYLWLHYKCVYGAFLRSSIRVSPTAACRRLLSTQNGRNKHANMLHDPDKHIHSESIIGCIQC